MKEVYYAEVSRINLRSEVEYCPFCGVRLQRTCTLSEQTIVTLGKVLSLVHRGYRCPDETCRGHRVVYRSAAADTLALPGFTFGLDVLILVTASRADSSSWRTRAGNRERRTNIAGVRDCGTLASSSTPDLSDPCPSRCFESHL